MIIDARSITENETLDCDICIVGAGAAGITLAQEFLNQDVKVLLLESGGIKYDANLDILNQGEVDLTTHSSLQENRRRQLGGATTVWGGRSVPFDASDFEYKSHVPYSGWPITKKDLDPYYEIAHKYCELGAYNYTVDGAKSIVPGLNSDDISTEQIYLFSPPTNFGKRYLNVLKNAPNITLVLNANCLKIATDDTGNSVDYLDVASLRKNNFRVRAKQYVLATGGLEVTRLLLVSNDVHKQGIGNRFNHLGRYYMGHINSYIKIKFAEKVPVIWDYQRFPDGLYYQHSIAIREEKRQEYGLLNQRFFVERPNFRDPSHHSGILSATYLTKSLIKKQKISQDLSEHLKNIIFDPQGMLGFSYKWITQRILSQKKLPSVIIENKSKLYTFRIDSEQIPNPNSLVSLSESKDIFGINQLKVDWRCSELDIFSVEKSVEILKQALENTGSGKVLPGILTSPPPQAGHHLGTTRMSNTPQTGVVDANCKVYDVSNLYIASSSVFTTSSYANPTLTVVALAARLADCLKRLYGK
ncbi:GMC family oxidoreductase [Calothrix sp. FACHB-1219]|uniref:GMC oxidoreductase n=1 Tax=unclassified Calothrix TaxID=2619626 RepID=UPI001684212B|nr:MULTISPECIES: GMC family oxidoreductase [unclassified Calothrix]MBD2200976.1 GMC family oxidoreductase [Calothrix sp. FACHB-168]MBD2219746.1 GMC family oxidoreductase [Calothrix sp. FACHB-1219]